jgi:hypothetical protein
MANFNQREDRATPAVELAPAILVEQRNFNVKMNQTVSFVTGATLMLNINSLLLLAKAAKVEMKNVTDINFRREAQLMNKLLFMAVGVEATLTFSKMEIELMAKWLTKAISTDNSIKPFGNSDEYFDARSLCLDLREILIPEISNEETAAVHDEINRQAGSKYVEDIF